MATNDKEYEELLNDVKEINIEDTEFKDEDGRGDIDGNN